MQQSSMRASIQLPGRLTMIVMWPCVGIRSKYYGERSRMALFKGAGLIAHVDILGGTKPAADAEEESDCKHIDTLLPRTFGGSFHLR